MITRLAPVIAISLLAGCSTTNNEQFHQDTLIAIQKSESNLTNEISNLQLQMSNQNDYIDSLENDVSKLSAQVERFEERAFLKIDEKPEPKVAPMQVVVQSYPSREIVLGEIERVNIDSINQTFDARVDTGAATSSLNAVDIEEFERNGKKWVRFHLSNGEKPASDANWIEAPIIRYVKIRQSTTDESERRAVIELWVKVGKIHEKTQFTLADRSLMSHPVLLGREFIRDIAVVDVSRRYIHTEIKQK